MLSEASRLTAAGLRGRSATDGLYQRYYWHLCLSKRTKVKCLQRKTSSGTVCTAAVGVNLYIVGIVCSRMKVLRRPHLHAAHLVVVTWWLVPTAEQNMNTCGSEMAWWGFFFSLITQTESAMMSLSVPPIHITLSGPDWAACLCCICDSFISPYNSVYLPIRYTSLHNTFSHSMTSLSNLHN